MSFSLHHQVEASVNRGSVRRRDFLKAIPASAAATGMLSWHDAMTINAAELRKRGKACILLWMQGGPSQFETLSPKPGHANGGETRAISTNVSGIQIAETLPNTAKVMDKMCVVRSMTSKEGSHPRASYLMHTGYIPNASVKYPSFGSTVAHQIGDEQSDLPGFVRIGRGGRGNAGAGFLGVEYDPFSMQTATRLPDNTTLTTEQKRYQRRLRLMAGLEADYGATQAKQEVIDHRKLYEKSSKLVLSPKMNAFDINQESAAIRKAYGEGEFASGCLLARRLVESGITFVEVSLGNWDTHQDNFDSSKRLCAQMDQPYAQLLKDLEQRGMLDDTLVIWMGEFGRTPRINARGGRDHFPRAFNMALAGGGVQGGQVIGATDKGGTEVSDRPVSVPDLFRTFCHSLTIDPDNENMAAAGRPIKIVEGGAVVEEAFA